MGVDNLAIDPPEGLGRVCLVYLASILPGSVSMPFRKASSHNLSASFTRWAIKQFRSTFQIEGIGVLALNEIHCFQHPPNVDVLMVRLLSDPIGWATWGEVSDLGIGLALIALSHDLDFR